MVQIPKNYVLISISKLGNRSEYKLFHDKCGGEFKIGKTTYYIRLKSNKELCTHCNPIYLVKNDIKSLIDVSYDIIEVTDNSNWYHMKHKDCGNFFKIYMKSLILRLNKKHVLCIHCNPLTDARKINVLPNGYTKIVNNNKLRTVLHIKCGNEFTLHRKTLLNRIRDGHELCSICNPVYKGYSSLEIDLVNYIESIYKGQIMSNKNEIFRIGLFTLDIYIPDLKLGIEFNGDYHHANPKFYKSNDVIKNHYKTAKLVWEKDKRKINLFKRNNISIFTVWEHDWKNNIESVKTELKKIITG